MTNDEISERAYHLCYDKGHRLAYLVKFGSHLYGTNTPESDEDYRGIFLPSKESLLLSDRCKTIRWGTGDEDERNSSDDIDIDLWSIHHFVDKISKGEVNAIDLLFSVTNKNCVVGAIDNRGDFEIGKVIHSSQLCNLLKSPLRLFNPSDVTSYVGYCMNQAAKYGIKGSRLGVLKDVYDFIQTISMDNGNKLSIICDSLLDQCYDEKYCFTKEINGVESLVLCGKVHMLTISLNEFATRIEREYNKYGERAERAMENDGIDWKALSHAVRALFQMRELLERGHIDFPLKGDARKAVLDIKTGKMGFKEVERYIVEGIESVNNIRKHGNYVEGRHDSKFVKDIILSFY